MDKTNDMHFGSNAFTFQKAEELRKRMTKAELVLWEELRGKRFMGLKFRRQHPIDRFIVDFYCHKYKLIIELDGSIHDLPEVIENDKNREEELKELGLNIIRFTNDEVLNNTKETRSKMKQNIELLAENPPLLFHPLGLGKRKVEEDFKLYPNPATDYFTLEYQIDANMYSSLQMEIYDATGRKIISKNLNNSDNATLIDVRTLSKGVYNVSFIADGKILSVEKLTIIK